MMRDWESLTAVLPAGGGGRYFKALPLRIGIVCDPIFYESLDAAADFVPIRFAHWEDDVAACDTILVVSSWHGLSDDWPGMAAPGGERREVLVKLMDRCRSRGLPVIFLSKEDPPSYGQFVEYALHADCVFTSASEKIGDYCRACGHDRVYPFRFCINPCSQNPVGSRLPGKNREAVFAGSWYRKFPERCKELGMLLDGAIGSERGLAIFDRMSGVRNGERFRFPDRYARYLQPAVGHALLQKVCRTFDWAINANSVTDSETMFAGRIPELMALGVLPLSNRSVGMEKCYPGVFVARSSGEAAELLNGVSQREIEALQTAGVRRVMTGETCHDRLREMLRRAGLSAEDCRRHVLVVAPELTDRVREQVMAQTYRDVELRDADGVDPETYRRADIVAFFDGTSDYGRFYLQDMVDAFKYADCDYVTKEAYDLNGERQAGREHAPVEIMPARARTVFWRRSFEFDALLNLRPMSRLPKGYSADALNYSARSPAVSAGASRPRVSVVIPVFNAQRFVNGCLASVLGQGQLGDVEVICVDDGSTDYSLPILEVWRNRDTRVKVVRQEHAGPGVARNRGLELAIGEFVLFLDADDELPSGETLLQAVEAAADTGCDVLCCSSDGLSSDGKRRVRNPLMFRAELVPGGKTYSAAEAGDALFFTTVPVPWAKLFRREFLVREHLTFPALSRSEDFPFVQMALALGRISSCDIPLVLHRRGVTGSLERTKDAAPLVFAEAEDIFMRWLGERKVPAGIVRAARCRALLRLDYNLRFMNSAAGLERAFGYAKGVYADLRSSTEGCGVSDYLSARTRLDECLSFASAEDWLQAGKGKTAPKVSVVIPVYNVRSYLRQCLDSVVNQTLKDIEIICVDDGSTDGSPAILAEYAAKDPRIRVLTRGHANAGAARNAGMSVATGEYCFFADADDFLGASALERLAAVADRESDDVVVIGHKILERGVMREKPVDARTRKSILKKNQGATGAPSLFVDVGVVPWNKLFRRSFLVDAKLAFRERERHNDVEFVCLAVALAAKVGVFGGCGYVYRKGRTGSVTHSAGRPDAFVDVFRGLRRDLETFGLWPRYSASFQNLALAHCFYHLLGEADAEGFEVLYAEFHRHVLAELGLDRLTREAVVNPKHWRYLQATLANGRPTELFMVLLRERYEDWKTIERLKERVRNAN